MFYIFYLLALIAQICNTISYSDYCFAHRNPLFLIRCTTDFLSI